eukprot:TRINITY_DN1994_c1_g1_i1.p2 TRINITY_DN1994_c1_g1~~TRINITY_DN1994_c1_g1_i1.p2  ORF type:complete len:381 (-),score=83.57 TRINITY_DN1994_c1_g1_i1:1393-2427(-)
MCWYGADCYRKNPEHLRLFRHTKKKSPNSGPKKSKKRKRRQPSSTSTISSSEEERPKKKRKKALKTMLSAYQSMLETALVGTTIDVQQKRLLRTFRETNNISIEEHNTLVEKCGWKAGEYEDGEREEQPVLMSIERSIYMEPKGYKLIKIRSTQSKSHEEQVVWNLATSQFYQTMSEAQGNFTISSVGYIINTQVRSNFLKEQRKLAKLNPSYAEEKWGFHGTSEASIRAIAKTGFKHPNQLKKKVKLLDEGFFGKGIYFALYSDYAMWYSRERESSQVLLCKLLTGKMFKCKGRMDGAKRKAGCHSHFSPKGNEIIIFRTQQILPQFIITFEENEASERVQED